MSIDQDPDLADEDDYDEEADSDFMGDGAAEQDLSSSSDEDTSNTKPAKKQTKPTSTPDPTSLSIDLDSGDEATIKGQRKTRRKQKRKGEQVDSDSDNESGWRARTRAMREREKDEKKVLKHANIHESTIDVDAFWAEMNRPGPLAPLQPVVVEAVDESPMKDLSGDTEQNKENIPLAVEEMITIKRKYKFAGEVHIEEKVVPKSSAEARLWLAQQESKPTPQPEADGTVVQRPIRKISRFDPNLQNLGAFKMNLSRAGTGETFKGPKLNVVEKSKMDWASHVDAEGLKDELDEHAKAKEGYHGRMEFLSEVEMRREEEARLARLKR